MLSSTICFVRETLDLTFAPKGTKETAEVFQFFLFPILLPHSFRFSPPRSSPGFGLRDIAAALWQ